MNVLTIPPGAPFAGTLAKGLIARLGAERDPLALAACTVFLPTRRAARALGETFARVLGGAALLPTIRPLGDVDEDDLLFDPGAEDLALPPAIAPLRRRLLLSTLVKRWDERRGNRLGFAQTAALARGLAHFLDEAQTQAADLSMLDGLVDAPLARHWAEVRDFLVIIRDEWPGLLAAEGALDPADHRNRALESLAQRLKDHPPEGPVIAAGSTGSIPATANLLGVIARLPRGSVVLPGLDRELDEESWQKLDPGHPQYGMKQLLVRIGMARDHVGDWQPAPSAAPARENLLRETLRPAPTTDAWRAIAERGGGDIAEGLLGMSLIEAAHPGEEATAVALVLRHALEDEGRTAALVTPDRDLARRVAAEMERWHVAIDDSAGRPLSKTPPGAFLVLLAEAARDKFAPVPLLALLKHPLAAGGEAPGEFRAMARLLDRKVLRGPRPDPGLKGLRAAVARTGDKPLIAWLRGLSRTLAPLEKLVNRRKGAIDDLAGAHAAAAEGLAASDVESGAGRLWRGEAGESARNLFAELRRDARGIADIETRAYAALFAELADERPIRPTHGRHPRLAILGLLEARLLHFDTVVLGSLNEGTWPGAAAADPWLSRPMREALGLESPERAIGLAAHDFAALAAGPRVVLSRAAKAEGSPTVASRWIQRLTQLVTGLELDLPGLARGHRPPEWTDYAAIARQIDEPERAGRRMPRPRPAPPVAARPRSLSVTEIETWLRDPYAIYARHVLGLKPLDALDAEIGARERGIEVHAVMERFFREIGDGWPDDAAARLTAIAEEMFAGAGLPRATHALWKPLFANAARWFAAAERARRGAIARSFVELGGQMRFAGPAGEFILRCRADRIDRLRDGGAVVIDYKTGAPPSRSQVEALIAPQLPLEAAILKAGGFAETGPLEASELLYIRLSGGETAGALQPCGKDVPALVADAEGKLAARIAAFDDKDTPYLPRVKPFSTKSVGDYDHLARVREWSLSGWEGEEE
ncbi:MAG TPA: double-strand break repair protein AddB [Rhizomicrobium sp.]|nr:double-strand break repair protein AddB [Rhizomicrobium sp.]